MSNDERFYITVGEYRNDANSETVRFDASTLQAMANFLRIGCLNIDGEVKSLAESIESVIHGHAVVPFKQVSEGEKL